MRYRTGYLTVWTRDSRDCLSVSREFSITDEIPLLVRSGIIVRNPTSTVVAQPQTLFSLIDDGRSECLVQLNHVEALIASIATSDNGAWNDVLPAAERS